MSQLNLALCEITNVESNIGLLIEKIERRLSNLSRPESDRRTTPTVTGQYALNISHDDLRRIVREEIENAISPLISIASPFKNSVSFQGSDEEILPKELYGTTSRTVPEPITEDFPRDEETAGLV